MPTELENTVRSLREYGGDTTDIEVKTAAGGLSDSLVTTLCALANLPGGGLVILGLDERQDFAPVNLANPQSLRQGLIGKARSCTPPVQLSFIAAADAMIEGVSVVAARVAECDPSAKPCRVAATHRGWLRGWDGDYMMSDVEEQAFLSQRQQPRLDRQPVPGAGRDDLDPNLVSLWAAAVKDLDPHGLGRFKSEELLLRGGVVSPTGAPTVAGILALGRQPQQFYPRFVVNMSAAPPAGTTNVRAINPTTVTGPIPVMLDAALDWARKTFTRTVASDADGSAHDRYQYPLDAFRELIGNALVHRDLSPWSEGDAVEVRLLADRLVVTNPGGLYGITVDRLGREGTTSARNARLLEVCKYTRSADGARVVETLASGIPRVLAAIREAGLPPPRFQDTGIRFTVVLRSSLGRSGAGSPAQALVHRSTGAVLTELAEGSRTAASLVAASGLSPSNVRRILRRAILDGLVLRDGGQGKPTTYRLDPGGPRFRVASRPAKEPKR